MSPLRSRRQREAIARHVQAASFEIIAEYADVWLGRISLTSRFISSLIRGLVDDRMAGVGDTSLLKFWRKRVMALRPDLDEVKDGLVQTDDCDSVWRKAISSWEVPISGEALAVAAGGP